MTRQLPIRADRRVHQRRAPVYAERPDLEAADTLPFVGLATRGSWAGPGRRCHWLVRPSGDYVADCRTGAEHAGLLFQHLRRFPGSDLTMPLLLDMIRVASGEVSGVEVGFLEWIVATVNPDRGRFTVAERLSRRADELREGAR